MKLSLTWLNNFLSLDGISPVELAQKLTMNSFEVEEIIEVGADLKGPLVIGQILDIQKHPNADKLSVTKVTTDGKNELQIVCGAKNIEVGQKVPVSLVGAEVVNRQDGSKLVIKKAKIRDIESSGMLCSPGELGINSENESGILILPENAPVGKEIVDYLSLQKDIVLEVAARSNRGDALSVYGLSKEVSALTGRDLKEISFIEPKSDKTIVQVVPKIENTEDTFIFYTAVLENIKVKESPNWLKKLLQSAGIRSINNIVDITNYINFSFGQPMHAYDKEKLTGKTLISRISKKDEKILTLDGKLRNLKEGVLVIADEKEPVAIAGIMGGKDSEVTESTKSIVFESAVFSPLKVRRGSRSVGLTSEASRRFERGVDSNFTLKSLLKAIELTNELAKDNISDIKIGPISKAGQEITKSLKIKVETKEIKRVLGINLEAKKVAEIISPLGFKSEAITDKSLEVTVPSHRMGDVSRSIDVIEEVARLYGYDNIEPLPPPSSLSAGKISDCLDKVKNYFISSGFSESYISSLIGEEFTAIEEFKYDDRISVKMLNPLSKEHSILRQTLIPGLIQALKLNQNYGVKNIKLFELGKSYFIDNSKTPTEKETSVNEVQNVSGVLFGKDESWLDQNKLSYESIFFQLKGIIDGFFISNNLTIEYKESNNKLLHPTLSLKITLNHKNTTHDLGFFGCIHPGLESKLDASGPIAVFEINLSVVLELLDKNIVFKKISSMPVVERDLTADISKDYKSNEITKSILSKCSNFVTDVYLINVFELNQNTRSLTYRFKMQDLEQTLTSKQTDDEIKKIKDHISTCFNASFRG